MRVAVLGTPCGGTGYATALLRAHGLDVGHEHRLADGIVCGFAALAQRRPGQRPERVRPAPAAALGADVVVRLIRHPLDVAVSLPAVVGHSSSPIGTATRAIRRSPEYQAAAAAAASLVGRLYEDGSALEWYEVAPLRGGPAPAYRADELVRLALRYWVETHEAIPARAPVLRLSSIDADWPAVAALLGVEVRRGLRFAPRSKGWRWPRWTWERWAAEDPDYAARGRALWERHDGGGTDADRAAARRQREAERAAPAERSRP